MLNQVILVGRVTSIDKNAGIMTIEVIRKDVNQSGLIPINLGDELAESSFEYLKEDSTVGVKASINIDDGILRIIGEKVTFINPVA
jgi:hypothetical protein